MASVEQHLDMAAGNRRALKVMLPRINDHPEWVITMAFYTAVHFVEASRANRGAHSSSHADRNAYVKTEISLRSIKTLYDKLYTASLVARYLPETIAPEAMYRFSTYYSLAGIERWAGEGLSEIERVVRTEIGHTATT